MREETMLEVRKYLDDLSWDGTSRYPVVVNLVGGAEPEALKRFFLDAVRRVYEPGCKVEKATVFVGPQGSGKSYFLRALGGPWYGTAAWCVANARARAANDKAMTVTVADGDFWIVELELPREGEIDGPAFKAFLAATCDVYRRPYAKILTTTPRNNVVVPVFNDRMKLKLSSGTGRRLNLVDVEHFYTSTFTATLRDQLWAQAAADYRRGVP